MDCSDEVIALEGVTVIAVPKTLGFEQDVICIAKTIVIAIPMYFFMHIRRFH